jgi:acyl-CoA thioesterase
MSMDSGEIARACADAMWADDSASRGLGIQLISVEPGRAVLAMTITEIMVNGHNIAHGGFIFTLADSAFAYASNSYDQRTVAQQCAITFIEPGKLGDRLIAKGVERNRTGRSGIYDITVTRDDGAVIAEFRGHCRTIEGTLLPAQKA